MMTRRLLVVPIGRATTASAKPSTFNATSGCGAERTASDEPEAEAAPEAEADAEDADADADDEAFVGDVARPLSAQPINCAHASNMTSSERTYLAQDAREPHPLAGLTGGHRPTVRTTVIDLGRRAGVSRNVNRAVLAAALEAVSEVFEILADMIVDARGGGVAGLLDAETNPEQLANQSMVGYLGSVLHFTSTPRAKPLMAVLAPLVANSLALAENRHASKHLHVRSVRRRG